MRIYLVLSILLPILLVYPALIYADLAGFGGYDGFAIPNMMVDHGVWPSAGEESIVYRLFNAAYCLWLPSVLNATFAVFVYVLFGRNSDG